MTARSNLALALVLGAALAACRQTPKGPARPTPSAQAISPSPLLSTDPASLRFRKVDMLISQWDVAQASGQEDKAQAIFDQVRREVDEGYADFAAAAAGGRGLQLQYLAASALGFTTRPEATKLLVDHLTEADPKLRGNILIALKLRADPATPILPVLQQVASSAPEPRRYAPLAIANVLEARRKTPQGVDDATERQVAQTLSGVVADRDPYVRLHVAKALGELRRPGAYDLLMILMKDEYPRIRLAAAAGLERVADPRGFPEVVRLLGDSPDESKLVVRELLASYGGKIRGTSLSEDEKARLGTSTEAWYAWYDALRQERGWPVDERYLGVGNPGTRASAGATSPAGGAAPPRTPPARGPSAPTTGGSGTPPPTVIPAPAGVSGPVAPSATVSGYPADR